MTTLAMIFCFLLMIPFCGWFLTYTMDGMTQILDQKQTDKEKTIGTMLFFLFLIGYLGFKLFSNLN